MCVGLGSAAALAQMPAFPGAEGGGMYARGGRGGRVLEVTTLHDTTATNVVGTLRWAVAQPGARTVVFRVSGTITLVAELKIQQDSITIAGQTAPGDGICLRGYQLRIDANQIILRHLRVRPGDEKVGEHDAITFFNNGGTTRRNIIIDHCSASWSVDEALSGYGNDSVTVQWCIVSESLRLSGHVSGAHGYGGIWGGHDRTTFHHNLFAHHTNRTPRISGGLPFRGNGTVASHNVDIRNNVIYNAGSSNSFYGGEAGSGNIVNNYYKRGPASTTSIRVFRSDDSLHFSPRGQWYIDGNVLEGYTNAAVANADNWTSVGVLDSRLTADSIRTGEAFPSLPVSTHSALEAFTRVLESAGAIRPRRDSVDTRIVSEAQTGTAQYGANGIIDEASQVGGWPLLNSLPAPTDTDHDGMPDEWETARGSNPADAADRNLTGPSGYTRLEEYLNQLGDDGSTGVGTDLVVPAGFSLEQNFPNPFNPSTTLRFTVASTGPATLSIFNLLGQPVARVFDGIAAAGSVHTTVWDGSEYPSGMYVARLQSGGSVQSRRMILLK